MRRARTDPDAGLPQEFVDSLRRRREAMVAQLRRHSEQTGLLLFEGRWLTPAQIKRVYRKMRLRGYGAFFEVAVLVAVFAVVAIVFPALLAFVVGL